MSGRRLHKFIYYTHLPLVFLGMVLTGTISAVLYGQITWQVILLVGLSTYLTYSLDNLFDWNKDKEHYANLTRIIQAYHKLTFILIPTAAIGITLLIVRSSNELQTGILLLGAAVAMATTRFSSYRKNTSHGPKQLWGFFTNRIFISFIWTMVCVFLPIWYNNHPVTPFTWHTFLYLFALILSFAIIWRLEKGEFALKKKFFTSRIPFFMTLLPIFSILVVIYDVISGYAPLHNLLNIPPAIACLGGLIYISKNPLNFHLKISLITIILILFCAVSAVVHLSL